MKRRTWFLLAISLSAGCGLPSPAQPAGDGPPKPLPAWLAFSAEALGRADSASAFDPEGGGRFYWSRLRAGASLQPSGWFRMLIEGQDARGASLGGSGIPAGLHDPFDLLQAWAEVGRAETGWRVRIGRQELVLGDERLLGSDRYWDWFGQVFDAVRADYSGHRLHAAAFSGFRVEPSRRRINPFDTASRIAGASLRLETGGEGELEPFVLWKRGGNTVDLMGRNGHRDVVASGLRAQRSLPWRLDGNFEMVLERGHVAADALRAWAGHWELGCKPLGKEFGLHIGLEYNYASGDSNPGDGRHGTFDDLYPAGFNQFGMADPIAWRNIRYPAISAEVPLSRRWTLYSGYRRYWLATIHDGLYPGGDEFLVRNPAATGSYVGSQALVSVGYSLPPRWKIYTGYGHLFAGDYLRQSGYPKGLRTAYVLSSLTF